MGGETCVSKFEVWQMPTGILYSKAVKSILFSHRHSRCCMYFFVETRGGSRGGDWNVLAAMFLKLRANFFLTITRYS